MHSAPLGPQDQILLEDLFKEYHQAQKKNSY